MIINGEISRQARRALERKEKKNLRANENLESEAYKKITCVFKKVFPDEKKILDLAKKSKFYVRERNLIPYAFVIVLLIGCIGDINENPATLERICLLLKKWFKIEIKPQSLQKRINKKSASNFIKEVMGIIVKHYVGNSLKKIFKSRKFKISLFNQILMQDSTIFSLPDSMSRIFSGSGGTSSAAAVKIDFIIDLNTGFILRVKCTAGRTNDGKMGKDINNVLEENDLVLRDLGYYNLSEFSKFLSANIYFISRLSINTYIYLNKDDEEPININKHLTSLGINKKKIDIDVFVGKNERIPLRLIGIKVPKPVVEKRKQQYKKKNHGREASEAICEWNKFTLMITNVDRRISINNIINLYKLRWQIELFFKAIKSKLNIDNLTGENKYRIQCLIFIKIILVLIVSILFAYAQLIGKNIEISLPKFIDWLKDGRLKEAILENNFTNIYNEIEWNIDRICKKKRRRKTSLEKIKKEKNKKTA
jgi:hypothetical protein